MKYMLRTSVWFICLVMGALALHSSNLTEADPIDDLSLNLGRAIHQDLYRLISEEEVDGILSQKLDFFPKSQTLLLAKHLLALCKFYRFDPSFVLSLIEVESQFKVNAISPMGAVGLMQMRCATAKDVIQNLGFKTSGYEKTPMNRLLREPLTTAQLMDPFVNTALGIAYLAWLRDHYEGYLPYYFLAAYNMGPSRLDDLLTQKNFRPYKTQLYFKSIRNRIPQMRIKL